MSKGSKPLTTSNDLLLNKGKSGKPSINKFDDEGGMIFSDFSGNLYQGNSRYDEEITSERRWRKWKICMCTTICFIIFILLVCIFIVATYFTLVHFQIIYNQCSLKWTMKSKNMTFIYSSYESAARRTPFGMAFSLCCCVDFYLILII